MEHLVLSAGARLGIDENVRYVAKNNFKGIPFKEYLKHAGAEWVRLNTDESLSEEASSVYQTWLFFSLFQEVLGPAFFRPEDYVCTRLDAKGLPGTFLTTEKLVAAIESWRDHCMSRERVTAHYKHIQGCIEFAIPGYPGFDGADRNIGISIASAAALLAGYVGQIFDTDEYFCSGFGEIHSNDLEIMRRQGWCPFEAAQAWTSFRFIQTQMLLRTSRRAISSGQDHSDCDMHNCQHSVIPAFFTPSHVRDDCCCSEVSFQPLHYTNNFANNRICALEFTFETSEDTSPITDIDLVGIDPLMTFSYIAISHVWADGLGNARKNSLPRCQLEAIIYKIRASFPIRTRLLRIWLDVLCCPAEPAHLRSVGISRLQEVYSCAAHVLVLDRNLQLLDAETTSTIDLAVSILSSRWVRRLWTLQEGIMARELRIQAANGPFNVSKTVQTLKELQNSHNPALSGAYEDLHDGLINLQRQESETPGQRDFELNGVIHAVGFRSVSVASDEALCLGILLGERFPFVEEHAGQNMARFWRACVGHSLLSMDIIFNRALKLDILAFHWAPSTLMYNNHRLGPNMLQFGRADISEEPAVWNDRGLQVVYSGFVARPAQDSVSCATTFTTKHRDEQKEDTEATLVPPSSIRVYDSMTAQWWNIAVRKDFVVPTTASRTFPGDRLAFIRESTPSTRTDGPHYEHGITGIVLGWVDEEAEDITFVRSITTGTFMKHSDLFASVLDRVFLGSEQPTIDELTGEIASLESQCCDWSLISSTTRFHPDWYNAVRDYAEELLTQSKNQEYMVCTSVYNEPRTWVVD